MPTESIAELEWLEHWYRDRCDGTWEHGKGLSIESIDNPGWWVKINIDKERIDVRQDVVLAVSGDPPSVENGYVGGLDWMICQIKGGRFDGAGDPGKLRKIVQCFREMVVERERGTKPGT